MCKDCYNKYERDPETNKRLMRRRAAVYEEWCERIKKIPKTYPTLTEAQWLEAVKHFDGCALCENETVDTRMYFIPLSKGGRYCDWNIIPVCEKCATQVKPQRNFFAVASKRPIGLQKIVDYLEDKINGALAKGSGKH